MSEANMKVEIALKAPVNLISSPTLHMDTLSKQDHIVMLAHLISENSPLVPFFQPIRDLKTLRIVGVESLQRWKLEEGCPFPDAEALYRAAEDMDMVSALDELSWKNSFRGATVLLGDKLLFLNCSVKSLLDPGFQSRRLAQYARQAELKPSKVVLEITERVGVRDWQWEGFREVIDQIRSEGFRVAVDDTGSGYSSLRSVAEIKPDYLKVDRALVRDVHVNEAKLAVLEVLVDLSSKIGATLIAEGIEQREESLTVQRLGVALGQGSYLGKPTAALADDPV